VAQVPPPAAAHRAGAAALLAEGQRLYAAGEVAAALQRANEALELDAGLAGAWQLAAIVERRLGRHQVARGHFERALQAAPDDPHILNSFGNLLSDLGEPDEARRCYELALAADPGHSEARVNLAGALKRLGLRSRARSELQAVLDAAPGHGRAWHALGLLLFEEGEHEAAAAALDRTLELQPANLSALRLRGEVAGEIGEPGAPYYARRGGWPRTTDLWPSARPWRTRRRGSPRLPARAWRRWSRATLPSARPTRRSPG
jgi:tetratricopeptide (TPR) repeat protein